MKRSSLRNGKSFIELAPIVKEFYSWTLVRRSLTMKQIASQNKWRHDIQHDNNGFNDTQHKSILYNHKYC